MSALPCLHQESDQSLAVRVCSRCGGFVCAKCQASEAPLLCAECVERMLEPLVRSPFAIGTAWSGGWRLFKAALPAILAVNGLFAVPTGLVSHLMRTEPGVGTIVLFLYSYTVYLLPEIASISLMVSAAHGRPCGLQPALYDAWHNLWRVAWTQIRVMARVFLYMMLLVIPGLIPFTACWVAIPAAYLERDDPVERSKDLTNGQRWNVFALAASTTAVTILPLLAINSVLLRVFGKGSAGLVLGVCVAFLGLLGLSFRAAFALAAFYGLRNSREPSRGAIAQAS